MAKNILAFYSKKATDSEGRTLEEIRLWDDDQLEQVHNYIQWLFPLPEPSAFNPLAPVLSKGQIAAFRADRLLRMELLASFDMMLRFYGFQRDQEQITCADKWPSQSERWLTPNNHNFLRISRILRSLSLLGLQVYAKAFFDTLSGLYSSQYADIIGKTTYHYWRTAADSNPPGDPAR
ncbi:MAG: opioid growth factor receptor-related protein [Chthoniobacteraceae bacterium]|nr:opioid growth factor receptor-related protein [Chthoniobacteraceae bacterium]